MNPKTILFILLTTLCSLNQAAFAQTFEYEKREPIQVPADFPLVMIPAFHRGNEQSQVVLKKLNSLSDQLKSDSISGRLPLVLWTESKGIAIGRLRRAIESLPEISDERYKDQSVLLEDVIQEKVSKSESGVDPLLKRYLEVDAYLSRWNQWGTNAETEAQKKDEVKRVFEKEFFSQLISWGIDHRTVVSAEEKSLAAWQAIIRMLRLTEDGDLRLSYGDIEGAYLLKEMQFKYTVEMVYLRNRKIWKQFQQLHEKYPHHKIVAVIGEAHAPDFGLAQHQLLRLTGNIAPDASHQLAAIKKELQGNLSSEARREFIWNDYLKQKLIGQAPDTADFTFLSLVTEKIYGRMKMKSVSVQEIFRNVGNEVLNIRKANPEVKNLPYSGLLRKVLIDNLEKNRLITPLERRAFEGEKAPE